MINKITELKKCITYLTYENFLTHLDKEEFKENTLKYKQENAAMCQILIEQADCIKELNRCLTK